jgi:hypothetical protein
MKMIKWLSAFIVVIVISIFVYWLSFAILYSYGAGGQGRINNYQFEISTSIIKNEIFSICNKKSSISCKDSISDLGGGYKQKLIVIKIEKDSFIIKDAEGGDLYTSYNLISINGKIKDDFGWFSFEKHKKVKLFEKEIIEPLSKKYKYEKLE